MLEQIGPFLMNTISGFQMLGDVDRSNPAIGQNPGDPAFVKPRWQPPGSLQPLVVQPPTANPQPSGPMLSLPQVGDIATAAATAGTQDFNPVTAAYNDAKQSLTNSLRVAGHWLEVQGVNFLLAAIGLYLLFIVVTGSANPLSLRGGSE